MLTNLASIVMGYLGEPAVKVEADAPVRNCSPQPQYDSSDDDSWLLLDASDENDEIGGRLVHLSRSTSSSSLPSHPMEESWFLTPPPCFTSTPPSGLVVSPLENLLIEHPSMSVYHGRARARSATPTPSLSPVPSRPVTPATPQRQPLAPANNHHNILELKTTKKFFKKDFLQVTRNQIERNNKVREVNSRSRRQRRSDRQQQHSGANNNRKCC